MPGPWENYQPTPTPAAQGPWAKYGAAPPNAPELPGQKRPLPLPNGGDTGEDPIAQGLTTMETKLADVPKAIGKSLISPNPIYGPKVSPKEAGDYAVKSVKAMNPIDTEEGSTAMNIGGTAANLLPYLIDPAGGGIEESAAGQIAKAAPKAGASMVRGGVKGANAVIAKAPGVVGAGVGGAIGHAVGGTTGAEIGGTIGGAVGREILPRVRIPGENFGLAKPTFPGAPLPEAPPPEVMQARPIGQGAKSASEPAAGLAKIPAKPVYPGASLPEHPGTFSGAHLPEAPSPELVKARAIGQGSKAPGLEPSEGLGKIPAPKSEPVIAKPSTSPKAVQSQINDSLGGRPLQPGVKLRDQGKIQPPPSAVISDLTPVDSTAVKAYKYDPTKREFTATNPDGQTFIHGDVTPDEAKAFEKASSKGKAWKIIKDNHPLVAKIVNGQRISHIPSIRSASPDDVAPE